MGREAGDEGGQARGLRQGGVREGQARQDSRQGLLRGGLEEECLSQAPSVSPQGRAGTSERVAPQQSLAACRGASGFSPSSQAVSRVGFGPWRDRFAMLRLAGGLLVWHWVA